MDDTIFIGLEKNRIFFTAANIIVSKCKNCNVIKRFSTDKGVIDFIIKDKTENKIIFLLIVENKSQDFSKPENWSEVLKNRHLGYGIKWYLQKYEDKNKDVNIQIDIMEMFKKDKKVVAKRYKDIELTLEMLLQLEKINKIK